MHICFFSEVRIRAIYFILLTIITQRTVYYYYYYDTITRNHTDFPTIHTLFESRMSSTVRLFGCIGYFKAGVD